MSDANHVCFWCRGGRPWEPAAPPWCAIPRSSGPQRLPESCRRSRATATSWTTSLSFGSTTRGPATTNGRGRWADRSAPGPRNRSRRRNLTESTRTRAQAQVFVRCEAMSEQGNLGILCRTSTLAGAVHSARDASPPRIPAASPPNRIFSTRDSPLAGGRRSGWVLPSRPSRRRGMYGVGLPGEASA